MKRQLTAALLLALPLLLLVGCQKEQSLVGGTWVGVDFNEEPLEFTYLDATRFVGTIGLVFQRSRSKAATGWKETRCIQGRKL
ncbi:MAG: hypothetical protein ACK4P3_08355 [Fimbriimonadaceae bacterium]